jgi:hypothetical protein
VGLAKLEISPDISDRKRLFVEIKNATKAIAPPPPKATNQRLPLLRNKATIIPYKTIAPSPKNPPRELVVYKSINPSPIAVSHSDRHIPVCAIAKLAKIGKTSIKNPAT